MQGRGSPSASGWLGTLLILHCPCFPTPSRVGRTGFYEEYGVIRDVLQNHLTEILTLVAMELPYNVSSSEAVLRHKLQAFQALRGLHKDSAVLGQYQAYSGQVRREQQKPDSFHSLTPTFAGGPRGCPRLEAASRVQTPFGVGWKRSQVGHAQGGLSPRRKGLRLSGLPASFGSSLPVGSFWVTGTPVVVSVRSASTHASGAL